MRALVADDDLDFLDLITQALERFGAEVVRASSGAELQQAIARNVSFDLVVTDVSMPRMTGLEVMQAARAKGLPCPIVVMTALRNQITAAQVAALGDPVALLYKPFSIGELHLALRACLGDVQPAPHASA